MLNGIDIRSRLEKLDKLSAGWRAFSPNIAGGGKTFPGTTTLIPSMAETGTRQKFDSIRLVSNFRGVCARAPLIDTGAMAALRPCRGGISTVRPGSFYWRSGWKVPFTELATHVSSLSLRESPVFVHPPRPSPPRPVQPPRKWVTWTVAGRGDNVDWIYFTRCIVGNWAWLNFQSIFCHFVFIVVVTRLD